MAQHNIEGLIEAYKTRLRDKVVAALQAAGTTEEMAAVAVRALATPLRRVATSHASYAQPWR
jgi:hypothetical protein